MQHQRSLGLTEAIFAMSSVAFLSLNVYFQNWLVAAPAFEDWKFAHGTALLVLTSPSIFFAVAMLLAGVVARIIGYLPKPRMPFSARRILCGTIVLASMYPLGVLVFLTIIFGLAGVFGETHTSYTVWENLTALAGATGLLCAAGGTCVLLAALASRIVTRMWPPALLRWVLGVPLAVLFLSAIVHYVQVRAKFPSYPVWRSFFNSPVDMYMGMAWSLPMVIVVGVPILAAILGHWLYEAATAFETPSKEESPA